MKVLFFAALLASSSAFAGNCYTGSAIGCVFEKQVGVNHAAVSVHNRRHMSDFGRAVNPNQNTEPVRVGQGCAFPFQRAANGTCSK